MNYSIVSGHRVTAPLITQLEPNEIFVFGSNKQGFHGGGAARIANKFFGAEWGVGEGLTGQTYALPTMEGTDSFRCAVETFIACARQHPDKLFLVTPVGCGIAGYTEAEVAPWFAPCIDMPNIALPASFWRLLI